MEIATFLVGEKPHHVGEAWRVKCGTFKPMKFSQLFFLKLVYRWIFKEAITFEVVAFGVKKKVHAFCTHLKEKPLKTPFFIGIPQSAGGGYLRSFRDKKGLRTGF